MAKNILVDASFLVALLSRDEKDHEWAVAQVPRLPKMWLTCEAALSEAFHLLERRGERPLAALLRRGVVVLRFDLGDELEAVLVLMDKYANVPMSLADACLVRMSETLSDPIVLTTDADFRIYRRHSRQVIPCLMP
jgi:predicted nucleic acid-binding protein